MTISRTLMWQRDDGAEWCDLRLDADRLAATGVQLGSAPTPYRVDYRLETAPGFATTEIRLRSSGAGWQHLLTLRRFPDGVWTVEASEYGAGPGSPGCDPDTLHGAADVDLGLSPLTNTLPLRRLSIMSRPVGVPVSIVAAWISVPDLGVRAPTQDYTPLGPGAVRYTQGSFTADLAIDLEGIVTDYPSLATLSGDATALE
jgi:uncharacterized protein